MCREVWAERGLQGTIPGLGVELGTSSGLSELQVCCSFSPMSHSGWRHGVPHPRAALQGHAPI